jgi:hypothetical protein
VIKNTPLVHWYRGWRERRRIRRDARRIAELIAPKLWEDVRRRLANFQKGEIKDYAEVRAAQLAQPYVDEVMRTEPTLTGVFGSMLLLTTTEAAVQRALATAAKAR